MKKNKLSPNPMTLRPVLSCFFSILVWLFANNGFAQTKDARMTTAAWDAFNSNNFSLAISNASACIALFEAGASNKQGMVQGAVRISTTNTPTEGIPKNEEEKQRTLALGPLNSVSTCWFIEGDSYLQIAKADPNHLDLEALRKSRDAFKATLEFSHGRCWDTNGFFWSPARTAREERLPGIEQQLSTARANTSGK